MIAHCEDVEVLLQDYLDGYLLPSQRDDLEAHLAGCEACREELVLMRRLETLLEPEDDLEVPADLAGKIADQLPQNLFVRPWARRTAHFGSLGLAAVFVLFLVVMLTYAPSRRDAGGREVELVFHSPGAEVVNVAGDFNDWSVSSHPMRRGRDGMWRLSLQLPPGVYQYNFYVDSRHWAQDLGTPALVSDGFGGKNALLYIEG